MNTVNASTGFFPFQLHLNHSPCLLPPVSEALTPDTSPDAFDMQAFLSCLEMDVFEASDNLLAARVAQTHTANRHHIPNPMFKVRDKVMLSTKHHHCEYITNDTNHVAKFMLHYDGPYGVLTTHPCSSTSCMLD
ncbi:hypothetical protein ID866_11584 [Astraeus odoratus]|nr:hypothetical protein ID866_11584 [Astraeus odoratus]